MAVLPISILMKPTIPLLFTAIAMGFAAGWLAKPAVPASTAATTPEHARSSTRSESRPTAEVADKQRSSSRTSVKVAGGKAADEMDPEMKKAMEDAERKQKEMVRKKLKKQNDLRIAAMVRELGLNPEQEKSLRAFYDQQLEQIMSVDTEKIVSDPDAIKSLAAAMRGDGLNDYMKDKLDVDQQEALVAMQERQHKNKIEGRAMKTLAKLQQSLDLTKEQENEAYAILSKDAESQLEAQTDEDFVMRGYMETMGMGSMMGDDDLGSMIKFQQAMQDGGDPKDIIKQVKESRQAEVERKVELMSPVLNDGQLKQYRGQLENQSGIFDMMIQGMERE